MPYIDALIAMVANERIHERYVDISCSEVERDLNDITDSIQQLYSLDDYVDNWLKTQGKMHLTLLGEFGSGKTWFTHHYAERQLQHYIDNPASERFPLLIALRTFAQGMTVEQVINDALVNQYRLPFIGSAYEVFQELNRRGKLLLILDGFDEMARRVERDTVIDNYKKLADLVSDNSKVILTCRTEYYRLTRNTDEKLGIFEQPKFEAIYIERLSPQQIAEVINNQLGAEYGHRVNMQICDSHDLKDMASRPVLIELMLATIAEAT